jgi:hypothetical protein
MPEAESVPGRVRIIASLREAVMDGERRAVDVVCIRAGLSKNGNYYAPAVVRAMAPLFEGARAFADHPAPGERPERSIRDIVGYYREPRVDDEGVLRATLKVARGADWLWELVREAVEEGQPDLIGLSVDADARVVEAITRLNSCDVVTRASAGGRVERLLQADGDALRGQGDTERIGEDMDAIESSTIESAAPEGQGTTGSATDLKENFVSPRPRGEAPRDEGVEESLQQLREEVRRERRLLACERELDGALRGCALPAPVRERVEQRFRGRVFEGVELQEAIADERGLLAALTDAGLVRGMGFEKMVHVGLSEGDKLQKAFDQLFDIYEGERVPGLGGIREAYVAATGDAAVSGVIAPERLREADVTTASFSYLLGVSMNKRLLKDYAAWPSEWERFCTVTPIKDFKQQDRIRLGAFGSLSTVPEDTAYTTLTLSDTRAAYTPQKRGNLVAVTRETVVNDDLHAIRQIPGKLAVAAAYTLAEFVYGFLTAAGNIYDGSPLFTKGGAHNNSAVVTAGTAGSGAALSSGAMQGGVTAMRRQTNMAGKPIGLKPRYLVVSPELEWQAMVITKSAGAPGVNYNDINPMQGYAEVIVAPQLVSPTGWYLTCDPRVVDTIEIGFVGGQITPAFFVQDGPLYGANFTNDVLTYKVRHEYGGAVVDYRGLYQGNN